MATPETNDDPMPAHGAAVSDSRYAGFFDAFNRRQFFEAHEILEELWLPIRRQPGGDFYKGLIQLAGAFVHVRKQRPGPAIALFRLARGNLARYPALHQGLDLHRVLELITLWEGHLACNPQNEGVGGMEFPVLEVGRSCLQG